MPRQYNTLGRRIVAMLAEGGPRKHNILRAIAGGEERLQAALARLRAAKSIHSFKRQGGVHYALAKPRKA